jgi:hypothetical protein
MNKSSQIKTHFDSKIIVFFIIIFTLSCGLLLYNKELQLDCDDVGFKIETSNYNVGDLITFADSTKGANEWRWDFGDQSKISYLSKVSHTFQKEGTYNVKLLVNNSCTVDKTITVLPKNDNIDLSLIPKIKAPSRIIEGQKAYFRDLSSNAKSWEWRFGENADFSVDATDKNPVYTFKSIGKKTITLIINGDEKHVGKAVVYVEKGKEISGVELPQTPKIKICGPEVKGLDENVLKELINGVSSNQLSYSNFSKYFCKESMPTVVLKDGKTITLKELDEDIRDHNIKVKNIRIEKDKCDCVTSISLSYKSRLF